MGYFRLNSLHWVTRTLEISIYKTEWHSHCCCGGRWWRGVDWGFCTAGPYIVFELFWNKSMLHLNESFITFQRNMMLGTLGNGPYYSKESLKQIHSIVHDRKANLHSLWLLGSHLHNLALLHHLHVLIWTLLTVTAGHVLPRDSTWVTLPQHVTQSCLWLWQRRSKSRPTCFNDKYRYQINSTRRSSWPGTLLPRHTTFGQGFVILAKHIV